MTALGDIFAEIDARLAAIDDKESYERMPSGDPDIFPAIELYDSGDSPTQEEAQATESELSLEVVIFMEGHGGAETHDALLALDAAVVHALCGDEGGNLGGLVRDISAGARRITVVPLADKRRMACSHDFKITLATPRGDPRTFA